MNIFDWLTSCFSDRSKAMSLYKRGQNKAKKHDRKGAIKDYSDMIGMPNVPADLMAMVLYDRALAYVAAGDEKKGAEDLDAVLAMKEEMVNVKTMARQKLATMASRAKKKKK